MLVFNSKKVKMNSLMYILMILSRPFSVNFFNWEFIFSIGKKPFNLALGMGTNIGPVRTLEKGLLSFRNIYFLLLTFSCRTGLLKQFISLYKVMLNIKETHLQRRKLRICFSEKFQFSKANVFLD